MAVFLLLSIALIFLFVGFIAITYLIASFINEVFLKRSDNPKLYITIGFILSFMLFLLFSPLQHLAAMDANVFLACVLLLGECMIFSIAYLMQQKYRARISDNVRISIGNCYRSCVYYVLAFVKLVGLY
jgi:SNF family Na+-dependent transporter